MRMDSAPAALRFAADASLSPRPTSPGGELLPLYTMTEKRTTLILILIVAALYVLDQVTKWLVVFNFAEPHLFFLDVVPVVTDCSLFNFNLVRAHNQGVAFGMGDGTVWAPFVFLGVQIAALVALVVFYRRGFFHSRLLKAAWVCILAGVLGNMTDRLLQGFWLKGAETLSFFENFANGYVVDFLDFSFPWLKTQMFPNGYHWPAFNVADSCVCIAAGLFLIASFLEPKQNPEKDAQ